MKCSICREPLDAVRAAQGKILCAKTVCVRAWRKGISLAESQRQLDQLWKEKDSSRVTNDSINR